MASIPAGLARGPRAPADFPVHLPAHRVELTRVQQIPISVIVKGTIHLDRFSVVEADMSVDL